MKIQHYDPGRLHVPFTLEQWSSLPDGHGGHTDVWTYVATIWGAIEKSRDSNSVRAGDEEQVTRRTIIVRADPRVQPAMRLVAGQDAFIIETVDDPDLTGRYLRCMVASQVSS